ncbi:hypothetical protein DL98DRAFT_583833 [Cadophora sp. DSE1049]|nr:hypothetical protein DL98DRAFT_583833 [Cadophora sp. DSE1049]
MAEERITFDPDGDLLLPLTYPANEQWASDAILDARSNAGPDAGPDAGQYANPRREVEMLVSSRHMIFVSPVFKAMLQSNMREGCELQSTGRVEVPLPEDNPAALEILLNIIHGRSKLVPAVLYPDKLQDISMLVDNYEISEIVQIYAQAWFRQLDAIVPNEPGPVLISWLSMAWVFKLRNLFLRLTKIAILGSRRRLEMPPEWIIHLPEIVLDRIEEKRIEAIRDSLVLHAMISASRSSRPIPAILTGIGPSITGRAAVIGTCGGLIPRTRGLSTEACDAMLFTTLMNSASSVGLDPAPQVPYEGWSVKAMAAKIENLNVVSLCDTLGIGRPGFKQL